MLNDGTVISMLIKNGVCMKMPKRLIKGPEAKLVEQIINLKLMF